MRRGLASLAAAAALLTAIGCDRLPWSTPSNQAEVSGPTTVQSTVVPDRPAVLPSDILANVNSVPISRADMDARLEEIKAIMESQGQAWAPLPVDAPQGQPSLTGVLEDLINSELMSQDAVRRGNVLNALPIQRRWEVVRRAFFAREWLEQANETIRVNPDEVKAFYDANRAGFTMPARIRVRQLSVRAEEDAKRALAQLHGGAAEFSALTQQISSGPNPAQGGLLEGWVVREAERELAEASFKEPVLVLDPGLEAVAFAVSQPNGLSSYVKGADDRFHIFQLVAREEAREQPYPDVADNITEFLRLQKLQDAMDALRTKASIERFPDRMNSLGQ